MFRGPVRGAAPSPATFRPTPEAAAAAAAAGGELGLGWVWVEVEEGEEGGVEGGHRFVLEVRLGGVLFGDGVWGWTLLGMKES